MKNIILLLVLIYSYNISAQVLIGSENPTTTRSDLELQGTDGQKVLILPTTQDFTTLPKYNASEADFYEDDPTMEGMLLYNKSENKTKVYDGTKWENAFAGSLDMTTMTRAKMNSQTLVCILGICGADDISFNYNGNSYEDHLGIQSSADTFIIRQKGVYRINVNIGFTGFSLLGQNIKITVEVNGKARTYMSKNPQLFSSDTYVAGDEVVLYLNTGDAVRFNMSLGTSIGAGFTFGNNDYSNVTFERVL